jgi:hypothetical protein
MRSAAEYVVDLREQLDAVKRRLDVFRHRDFTQDQIKTLLRFLKRAYELGLASLTVAEARLTTPVFVLARVLCEDLIRTYWISISVANAESYAKRSLRDLTKLALVNIERGHATIVKKGTGESLSKVKLQEVLDALKKHDTKGPTIEQMAQKCGLGKVYDTAYRIGSLETHATMPGLPPLFDSSEKALVSQLPAIVAILRAILLVVDNRVGGHDTTPAQILEILNLHIGGK